MSGIGTTNGTKAISTPTTNSSARIFPKSRKLKESGFVKSSSTLIGSKKAAGETYLLKYPNPFFSNQHRNMLQMLKGLNKL